MKKTNYLIYILMTIFLTTILAGCGNSQDNGREWAEKNLNITDSETLEYAKLFSIDYTDDGCGLVTVNNEDYYLVIPEGKEAPDNIPDSVTVIQQPLNSIYVVGTGSMDFFLKADALGQIKYSSLEARDWEISQVADAINGGEIIYAGKYSAPDYELLLSGGCDLVVENTMITHSPEVLSQLHDLGFKSIVDHASYEDSVQGRMEWIKLYGYLTGNIDKAKAAFDEQKELIAMLEADVTEGNGKTVGFFSITAAGTVSVRKTDDYINNMITIAGGTNALGALDGLEGTGSSVIQMEAFYQAVSDCDILIYNGTIEGEVSSIADLISKRQLLNNCRAVQAGEVYCTSGSFYQSVMSLGTITKDLHSIITGESTTDFLVKLQ